MSDDCFSILLLRVIEIYCPGCIEPGCELSNLTSHIANSFIHRSDLQNNTNVSGIFINIRFTMNLNSFCCKTMSSNIHDATVPQSFTCTFNALKIFILPNL